MVRNWDAIRTILIALEDQKTPIGNLQHDKIPGLDPQEAAYNMRLLKEAGYIEATIKESHTGNELIDYAAAKRMTSSGHDLLDTLRQKTVWEKIKLFGKDKLGALTFDAVSEIGKAVVAQAIKETFGGGS